MNIWAKMIKMEDKRLKLAKQKKEELETKLNKVKGSPREEEFQKQLDKINDLIKHLEG